MLASPGLRFFLAEEVVRRRLLYTTNVGSCSSHASGGSRDGLCATMWSAMFCIVHSSRPARTSRSSPLAQSLYATFFSRFIISPGRMRPGSMLSGDTGGWAPPARPLAGVGGSVSEPVLRSSPDSTCGPRK